VFSGVEYGMQRNATVQPLLYRHGGVRAEVVGPSLVAGVVFWRGWMRNVEDGKGRVGRSLGVSH
jgi:hypothetical protein